MGFPIGPAWIWYRVIRISFLTAGIPDRAVEIPTRADGVTAEAWLDYIVRSHLGSGQWDSRSGRWDFHDLTWISDLATGIPNQDVGVPYPADDISNRAPVDFTSGRWDFRLGR